MSGSPSDPPSGPELVDPLAPSGPRRARPLDEAALDEVAAAIATLPEPLAAVAAGVEVARADGDATGVRKRLFELGVAVVRYALSLELGLLAERLGEQRAPKPLGEPLGRAARLSDGAWCALARTAASQLDALLERKVGAFGFLARKPLADLVEARNQFVHAAGTGDDAPYQLLALLADAAPMLAWPLCAVATLEPPSYEQRQGVPLRPGVWRKRRAELPPGVEVAVVYLVHDALGPTRWTPLAPWLPSSGRKLLLLDAPHSAGARWRSLDVETGEHRECPELDAAIRRLVGQDGTGPVAPTERPALVGREGVLALMRRSAELVRQGGASVVLLTGPQGVGRGRLLEVMREAAPAFGLDIVLEASCLEHRRGVLRPLRRALATAPPSLVVAREATERAAAGDALAGAEGLAAAVEAVEEALVEASREQPLLLLLDDAQWADEPTLRLLSLLTDRATRRTTGRLLVVAATRDEARPPAALTALVGQIERDVGAGATRVALASLEDETARRLVRGVAPLAPALEERLVAGAAGLPFLLVQPILAWAETGSLVWRDGRWEPARATVLTDPVPGVADVVQARLAASFDPGSDLEQAGRLLLAAVGVAGAPLGVTEITRVTGLLGTSVATTERALEVLLESGLLVSSGERHEVGFAQPMVQQAVLDGLRRRPWFPRLHRALLEVLAGQDERGEDAAFLASGYLELGDRAAGAEWLGRAIEHALTMGLFADAVAHADRLAAVAPTADARAGAELDAVDALARAGESRAARERLGRSIASTVDNPAVRLRARMLNVSLAFSLGEDAATLDPRLVDDAERLGDPRLTAETRLVAARASRGEAAVALVEQALTLPGADAQGDLLYRAHALLAELIHEARGPGDPACRYHIELARSAAQRIGSRWAQLDADNDLALLLSAAGEHDRALEALRRIVAESSAARLGSVHRGALVNLATFQWRAGRHLEAAAAAMTAVDECRRVGDFRYLAMALSLAADALQRSGDLCAARRCVDEAIDLKRRAADPNLAIALLRRADIAVAQGQDEQAVSDARLALEQATQAGHGDFAARARLWLALFYFGRQIEGARVALGQLVADLAPTAADMRPPTRLLLERAQRELGGTQR